MKPLLAQKYDPKKVSWPVLVSPKLDGIRCLIEITPEGARAWSRDEKPILSVTHILFQLDRLMLPVGTILDGELYTDQYSFQVLNGTVRRQYHDERSLAIRYFVYDVAHDPVNAHHTGSYVTRKALLDSLVPADAARDWYGPQIAPGITVLDHVQAWDDRAVRGIERMYVERGLEGAMVRTNIVDRKGNVRVAGYETEASGHTRRSWGLQKVKSFDEGEFQIMDVFEEHDEHGTPKGRAAGFEMYCRDHNVRFNASGLTDQMKAEVWANPSAYIGQMATCKYFGRSDDGVPRHPNFKALRPAGQLDSAV